MARLIARQQIKGSGEVVWQAMVAEFLKVFLTVC